MNLKTISFNAVVAATVVVGAATSVSPAHALSFSTSGTTTFVNPGGSSTTINFSPLLLSGSEFTPGTLGTNASGLTVNGVANAFSATSNPLSNFLTGFRFKGVNAVLNLDAGIDLAKGFSLRSNKASTFGELMGEIRSTSGSLLGTTSGVFVASSTNGNGFYSYAGDAVAIPTPALLPGLVAMGIGIMRKRQAEAVES